ncbi:MAG: hypothetical protein II740_08780, partial [Lachnospiraceae bacterium]|nr:hypothetical protein [Lachnospiraceae bacterium]
MTISEARNNLLQNWKNLGGRKNVIEALRNSFKGLLNVLKPVKDAFTEIFPPITAKKLYSLSKQLKDISSRFKISEKTASDLKNTFKGLFAVADILRQLFVSVFKGVFSLSGNVTSLASKILSITGAFGKLIAMLDDYIKKNDLINSSIQKVTSTINKIIETVRNFVKTLQKKLRIPSLEKLTEAFPKLLKIIQKPFSYGALSNLAKILDAILDKTNKASKAIDGFFTDMSASMKKIEESMSRNPFVKVLKKLWDICVDIAKKISKVIGKSFETLADKIESLNAEDFLAFFNSLVLLIKTIGVSKIFKDLGERVESFQNIIDRIAGVFDGIKDAEYGIVEILNSVRGCFEQYQKKLKAETLKVIAIAIGILAAAIFLLSTINAKELKNAIEAISVMFIELISGMAILSKISKNSNDFYRASSTMIALSFSMLILSSALKKVSVLKPDELKSGLLGIAGTMAIMVASLKLLGKDEKKVIKGAAGIIAFSVAVRILTKACITLSKLSWENLIKGLVGVGILLAEISLFLKFTKFNKKTIAVSSGIVILALAIKILANVCKDFSEMSWEGLAKGLSGIGILLAEISAFANLTSKTKHIISTSISLTIMGAALKIIASVLKDLSVMRWEELAKGIAGISGALASIVSALNLMPKDAINKSIALTVIGSSIKVLSYCLKEIASMSWEELAKSLLGLAGALTSITMALNFMPKNMVKIGTGLLMVSASLLVMSKALTVMGSMSWEEIAKSVTTLAGAMAILSVSLILMKKTSAGASALLIASAAISVLVPSLKALGSMSIGEIAASLIGMAGAFVVLGAASAVLGKMLPQIFALSVSIALIGAGIAAVGVGLVFAGLGLQEIAVGMLALGPSITVLTTEFLAALGIIYSSMDSVLIPLSKKSGELIAQLLKSLLKSVIESLPEIKTLIFDVLKIIFDVALEALKLSKGYIPKMVEYILDLVVNILKSITKKLPGLIKAVVDLLVALFTGVINALNSVDPEIFVKGILGLAFITAMMMALSYIAGLVPGAIAGALGASAVIAEITVMLAAFGALAQIPGLKWIVEEGGEFLQSIGTAIGQFLGGIAGGFASGMSSKMSRIGADLSDFMMNAEPFIEGAKKIDSSAMNGISALADAVLALTASNVLNGITSFFGIKASLSEFGNELSVLGRGLSEYYRETKNVDGSSIEKSSKGIAALFDMTKHIPNRGGLIGLVFGEKNLKTFANEFPKFGLAIKLYSQKVSDIDSTAVIKSAEACEILFDMLKNVPTTGGLMSMIFGETDVLGFAKNLSGFGSHLKKYGKSVKGVDVKSISNSAKATEALSTMVKNLPTNQSVNPVISWFTGQKNLVKFGETLELFAPSLKRYSVSIKGLNGKLVINSAKATEALSTMVKNLPTNQSV